jgi:hypothetical protein
MGDQFRATDDVFHGYYEAFAARAAEVMEETGRPYQPIPSATDNDPFAYVDPPPTEPPDPPVSPAGDG